MKYTAFSKICITIASILLTTELYAATTAPQSQLTTSSVFTPTAKQVRIKCHALKINNRTVLKPPAQYIPLGTSDCQDYNVGGLLIVMGVVASVNINPNCMNASGGTRPYMGGFWERGGGIMTGAGWLDMDYTCCSRPKPPVNLTSDTTTWQNYPSCP